MKKLLIALAAVLVSAATFGQGTISFNNHVGSDVNAPVYFTGTTTGVGPDYTAQLYLQPAGGGALTPLTPTTTFRSATPNPAAAAFTVLPAPVVAVPGVAAGGSATIVMRAWLTSLGTYDQAVTAGGGFGQSAPLVVNNLGGGLIPDANLSGLQGFFVTPLPEPGILALGVLGGSALLLRRRK